MKISKQIIDAGVLTELGQRIVQVRLQRNLTQIGLAEQAGISKRTLERMEAGGSVQLSSFIRVCRALDLLERFDALIPGATPGPMAQLKLRGKERKRASAARESAAAYGPWTWGDDT